MEKTLVLASGNEGKAREFRAILEPLGFKIVLQKTLGIDSPEENGKSFFWKMPLSRQDMPVRSQACGLLLMIRGLPLMP